MMDNKPQRVERIQKVIARSGKYSRRRVEQLLIEQRIRVNNKIVTLGCKVTDTDNVFIDGKPITMVASAQKTAVLLYNKAVGEICSKTEKPSVFDNLPNVGHRWINVGRLDINTSGLLLFTNNGTLAHKLMHPSSRIDREYAVRVRGKMDKQIQTNLTKGVMLNDGEAHFLDLVDSGGSGSNHWFHVVVQEGRHRLVRRLFQSQGLEVSRLMRVRFGTVVLGTQLRPKKWIYLGSQETEQLELLCEDNRR